MVDIKDLLDRFENPADYREVSWGGKKEEFFENLVAEKDAAVNKIIDLTNKKSLTPEIENKLNEIVSEYLNDYRNKYVDILKHRIILDLSIMISCYII